MSRLQLRGLKGVYRFTLKQTMINKANIVTLFILFLTALLSFPLSSLSNTSSAYVKSSIHTAYIDNNSGYDIDFLLLKSKHPEFAETVFEQMSDKVSVNDIGEYDAAIAISAPGFDNVCHLDTYVSPNTALSSSDTVPLLDSLSEMITMARYEQAGFTNDNALSSLLNYEVESISLDDYTSSEDSLGFDGTFAIQYAYSIAVMALCLISASFIIRCVVDEKSSKLVELLMVSISPLALLLGKIFAIMTYVFIIIFVMVIGFLLSYLFSTQFLGISGFDALLSQLNIDLSLLNINWWTIVIALFSLLLAFTTYAILSGLIGCCCNSIEDAEPATMIVTFLVMAGYIVSCVAPAISSPYASAILSLCPVISVFCAPVMYICARIPFFILVLSWIIQSIILILLSIFCARIYRDLLLYRGSRIKISQLFSLYKNSSKEESV